MTLEAVGDGQAQYCGLLGRGNLIRYEGVSPQKPWPHADSSCVISPRPGVSMVGPFQDWEQYTPRPSLCFLLRHYTFALRFRVRRWRGYGDVWGWQLPESTENLGYAADLKR